MLVTRLDLHDRLCCSRDRRYIVCEIGRPCESEVRLRDSL
jgi:hypothetical protein